MLQIESIGIDTMIPFAKNSRTHDDAQVAQIAASIKEFGFTNPVLIDESNGIIAGHGRVLAARKLKLSEVPCIRLAHLTDAQKRAYVIADNKLALNAGWDAAMLKLELADLKALDFDLDLTGFNTNEIDALLAEKGTEGLTDPDDTPEPPVDPVTRLGDVWICGQHRVMCGDSTSINAVDVLMQGDKADMVFTDPPYNIDYQGVSDRRKIKNDKMNDSAFTDFLVNSVTSCETMYVCCSWQYAHLFRAALEQIGRKPKALIVWDKVNPAQNLDKYFKQHELIWYVGALGGEKTLRGDVWTVKRQKNTVHPTMKPVELIEMALKDQPDKKVIVDNFGGSGSTLIAAEKNGRKARIMELDPKYCDVIIKRWQDFTGNQAILESTGEPFKAAA